MKFGDSHLAYCTNIHPAETWEETRHVLESHVLAVRDLLRSGNPGISPAPILLDGPFGIGLRLSAQAARELLEHDHLARFKDWLQATDTYVFTINGFPYGGFHGTRVKEKVFQPDWTTAARMDYTKDLFRILATIAKPDTGASVSSLPGSHKTFHADEPVMLRNLSEMALWLDDLSAESGHDFHLGLEPEPLGHFENTLETVDFFERLHAASPAPDAIGRRIGVNFDTCHFALEYDVPGPSLDLLTNCGIRISKIHLSSALMFDPRDPSAVDAIRGFDEPTYFHQVLVLTNSGQILRFVDLPEFLKAHPVEGALNARVHFHIPLDAEPEPPLRSTRPHVLDVLRWRDSHPASCPHYEIETYTWGVLPSSMRRPVAEQIAGEYRWVLEHARIDSGPLA